ncbi:hypothetical protein TNCV_2499851 [Trichonephila clavipes]|nr:hypothetical protein TNCV_2499851 [Trichonephila clavipes]
MPVTVAQRGSGGQRRSPSISSCSAYEGAFTLGIRCKCSVASRKLATITRWAPNYKGCDPIRQLRFVSMVVTRTAVAQWSKYRIMAGMSGVRSQYHTRPAV